jgi:hypothetical protein
MKAAIPVAFIYKGEDDPRLHDPGYSLGYEELVQLASAAKAGNSAAAFRLAQLPASERRLAKSIDKAFSGKASKKPGSRKSGTGKSRCIHCGKRECRCAGPGPQQQQPVITKAAAVSTSIKQDFLHHRYDRFYVTWDPGADSTFERWLGPEAGRSFQLALLSSDPIRKRCAKRYGITLDDLAPIPRDAS